MRSSTFSFRAKVCVLNEYQVVESLNDRVITYCLFVNIGGCNQIRFHLPLHERNKLNMYISNSKSVKNRFEFDDLKNIFLND